MTDEPTKMDTFIRHTKNIVLVSLVEKAAARILDEGIIAGHPIAKPAVQLFLNACNKVPGLSKVLPTTMEGKFTELDGSFFPTMLAIGAVSYASWKGLSALAGKFLDKQGARGDINR